MESIVIRQGVPDDAAGILDCLISTLSERVWFDRDEHELSVHNPQILKGKIARFRPGEQAYIVATVGDKLVGFILLVRGTLKSTKHAADFGMSILPGYREKGIGTQLVQASFDWAKEHKVEKLYCCTFNHNVRAIKLYEKFGFIQEGVREKQYKISGHYVDQILFGKMIE